MNIYSCMILVELGQGYDLIIHERIFFFSHINTLRWLCKIDVVYCILQNYVCRSIELGQVTYILCAWVSKMKRIWLGSWKHYYFYFIIIYTSLALYGLRLTNENQIISAGTQRSGSDQEGNINRKAFNSNGVTLPTIQKSPTLTPQCGRCLALYRTG